MRNTLGSLSLRYGSAIVCIVVATWVRTLLDSISGNQFPYATLFFAVLLTAWYGGFGPALVAVVLGAMLSAYFLIQPRGSFS
jgi:K+-sensing histidine kinase KdpD